LKYQLARLFKKIFDICSINPILKRDDESNFISSESASSSSPPKKLQFYVDIFFKICSHMLEYEKFLCYYEEKFQLSEQIDIVVQFSHNEM